MVRTESIVLLQDHLNDQGQGENRISKKQESPAADAIHAPSADEIRHRTDHGIHREEQQGDPSRQAKAIIQQDLEVPNAQDSGTPGCEKKENSHERSAPPRRLLEHLPVCDSLLLVVLNLQHDLLELCMCGCLIMIRSVEMEAPDHVPGFVLPVHPSEIAWRFRSPVDTAECDQGTNTVQGQRQTPLNASQISMEVWETFGFGLAYVSFSAK